MQLHFICRGDSEVQRQNREHGKGHLQGAEARTGRERIPDIRATGL